MQNSNKGVSIPHGWLGFMTKKEKKKQSPEYKSMKLKQIAKRRAKNKVAAKSRRINRMKG